MAQTQTQRITGILRDRIVSGEIAAGSRLPAIRELAQQHGVSEITIRGVLRELRGLGLIDPRPRVGSIVCSPSDTPGGMESFPAGNLTVSQAQNGEDNALRQQTIAMVLPSLLDPFFARMVHGAEAECANLGLRLLLVTTSGNVEKEQRELEALADQVTGILIFPMAVCNSAPYRLLESKNVPVVFIDRRVMNVPAPLISVNNEMAGYIAGLHAAKLERPLWFISSPLAWVAPIDDRLRGFHRALGEHKQSLEPGRILHAHDVDEVIGTRFTQQILQETGMDEPITLVTVNEAIARGAYAVLQASRVEVPQRVAVISFGDTIAPLLDPPMTSVWLGEATWGREAVTILHESLRGRPVTSPEPLIPHLEVRGSCGWNGNFCRLTALLDSTHNSSLSSYSSTYPLPA